MVALGAVLAALTVTAGLAAAPADAALKHFDGTVRGTNENAKTFRIETQSRTVKFKVNRRTEFERIPGGLSGLAKGDRVEVDAKRKANGKLVARQVEPQGGNGGAGDDNGGNGADDPPGDDNGQHGPNHD
jgi:hypothetical protein